MRSHYWTNDAWFRLLLGLPARFADRSLWQRRAALSLSSTSDLGTFLVSVRFRFCCIFASRRLSTRLATSASSSRFAQRRCNKKSLIACDILQCERRWRGGVQRGAKVVAQAHRTARARRRRQRALCRALVLRLSRPHLQYGVVCGVWCGVCLRNRTQFSNTIKRLMKVEKEMAAVRCMRR